MFQQPRAQFPFSTNTTQVSFFHKYRTHGGPLSLSWSPQDWLLILLPPIPSQDLCHVTDPTTPLPLFISLDIHHLHDWSFELLLWRLHLRDNTLSPGPRSGREHHGARGGSWDSYSAKVLYGLSPPAVCFFPNFQSDFIPPFQRGCSSL